jgi:hypothetical protein
MCQKGSTTGKGWERETETTTKIRMTYCPIRDTLSSKVTDANESPKVAEYAPDT